MKCSYCKPQGGKEASGCKAAFIWTAVAAASLGCLSETPRLGINITDLRPTRKSQTALHQAHI